MFCIYQTLFCKGMIIWRTGSKEEFLFRIPCVNNELNVITAFKGIIRNGRNAVIQIDLHQAAAFGKCLAADGLQRFGQFNPLQICLAKAFPIPDMIGSIRIFGSIEPFIPCCKIILFIGNAVIDGILLRIGHFLHIRSIQDEPHIGRSVKSILRNGFNAIIQPDTFQNRALRKGFAADAAQAPGQSHPAQLDIAVMCPFRNLRNALFIGKGIYQLYLMNYGHKYDQNESETITVELTANREPVFRMDKQQVMTGETVTFTFCAFDATAVELWADGEVIETIPLTNSRAVFTRAFAKSGDRQMAIRALREDGWTVLSDVQILKVTSLGALGVVQVTAEPEQLLGNSIKASWAAVENADGYVVYFRNEAHETIYQQSTTNCAVSVPATDVTQSGGYYFMVVAHGAGYDQSEGSAGVTVLDHLPGPVIVTPAESEIRTDTAVTLTWQEVAGAESYVVSLARKTDRVDAGGQPVYEKVWTAPNETVNVGSVPSYDLTGLVYGGEYRVAVGAVSTLESGRECIGWSERLFSVEMPKLTVTLKADTLTPNAGGQVTLTAAANHPLTQVVLTDETGAAVQTVSSGSEIVNGTRVFTFVISNEKQGGKTYTVTVSGIDELESAQSAAASLDIEWLDADAAVINSVMMESGIAWPDTDTVFTITANANTASVEVYLEKVGGSLLRNAGVDQSPEVLRPQPSSGEEKLFFYTVKFEEAGDYILRFIPVNAKDEKGAEYPYPVTVHPKGKLPAPRITNLEQNAVIPSSGYTVEWDPVVLGGSMDFGGYSVTVYVADGTWKPIPGQRDVFVGKTCQYTIPALEPGKDYRIEVYTVPEGQTVPSATVSGCDFVEFKAESPEITIVTPAAKSTCLVGSPIMVKGTATGGITKALVRLVTAGQNSKTIPVKDANGKSVDEIVVDVVNGEYSAVLNPVKDLKASAGDETDHAVEVYGFLDGQAIDINGRADSKWSMINLDMAGTFANGVGGNSWIFTDESIVISVKISNTVNDVKLYDGNVRLDVKADVSNPNCHLFTADDLASRKEGLHVITSKDADTGKVLGTVDVYVVSRADRVQVYCKSGMTATGWLIPRENYSAETSVAITENSHLMQRGILHSCARYTMSIIPICRTS